MKPRFLDPFKPGFCPGFFSRIVFSRALHVGDWSNPSILFIIDVDVKDNKEQAMEIQNKVFIVTGGASGLGEGTARMLAANGAKVVIADMQ